MTDACPRRCWTAAGVAGLLAWLALSGIGDQRWFEGLFVGLVVAGLLGPALVWLACTGASAQTGAPDPGPRWQADPSPGPGRRSAGRVDVADAPAAPTEAGPAEAEAAATIGHAVPGQAALEAGADPAATVGHAVPGQAALEAGAAPAAAAGPLAAPATVAKDRKAPKGDKDRDKARKAKGAREPGDKARKAKAAREPGDKARAEAARAAEKAARKARKKQRDNPVHAMAVAIAAAEARHPAGAPAVTLTDAEIGPEAAGAPVPPVPAARAAAGSVPPAAEGAPTSGGLRAGPGDSAPPTAPTAPTDPTGGAGPVPLPPDRPAPVPAEAADDLTRIPGVGPGIAATLRGNGVTRYAQISAWGDADIDRFAALLGAFGSRIRREDWPAQARRLAAGGQARPPAAPPDGAT